ncbi:unnamed protein product [Vitrella brassicaformis CCMP3155]|uniref:Uncharacterized protein n=1 Tax=Vitrella brassicaformis (strain CCMP3155) TaxID=1169540 RepID=A0A0G4GFI4_VITBC|nr:unnamed protein product [Vitrella brassicaformis CCMP3155]|eukprot:CEM28265.1 unnamed protein product [Vitrella brassicaformis CCMP3155]
MQRHSPYATPFVMEFVQKTASLANDLYWTIAPASLDQPPVYDAAFKDFVSRLSFKSFVVRVTVCNADVLLPPADAQECDASILANLPNRFPVVFGKLTLSSRLGCQLACQLASRLNCNELVCRGVTAGQALQVIESVGGDRELRRAVLVVEDVGVEGITWGDRAADLPKIEKLELSLTGVSEDVDAASVGNLTSTSLLRLRGLRGLHVRINDRSIIKYGTCLTD